MTYRDAQIQKMTASLWGAVIFTPPDASDIAQRLYDKGFRIPATPPEPPVPDVVVTEEAKYAANAEFRFMYTNDSFTRPLAAAFPHLLAANPWILTDPMWVKPESWQAMVNAEIRERIDAYLANGYGPGIVSDRLWLYCALGVTAP